MPALLVLLITACAVLAACGSRDDPRTFPPAAEPARSPAPATEPAGRVLEIGGRPEGVVADPRTRLVAVALSGPDALVLIDARTLRVRRRVPLPGAARHLRLARPGGPVLVPAESGDRLVEVALPSGRTRVTPVGDGPHDAAASGKRIFVADEFAGTLTVVQEGRRVARVPTPLQPGGVAAVPDGGPVAVVAVRERSLALYDPRTARRIAERPAGVGPTHVEAAPDGGRLYVADTDGGALLLFRTRPDLRLVRRIALPGEPYGTTLDRTRGKLWVTLTARNEVVEVSADSRPRVLQRVATVRQPNSVAVDEPAGRVFVAGRADGTLQVFDAYPRRR